MAKMVQSKKLNLSFQNHWPWVWIQIYEVGLKWLKINLKLCFRILAAFSSQTFFLRTLEIFCATLRFKPWTVGEKHDRYLCAMLPSELKSLLKVVHAWIFFQWNTNSGSGRVCPYGKNFWRKEAWSKNPKKNDRSLKQISGTIRHQLRLPFKLSGSKGTTIIHPASVFSCLMKTKITIRYN